MKGCPQVLDLRVPEKVPQAAVEPAAARQRQDWERVVGEGPCQLPPEFRDHLLDIAGQCVSSRDDCSHADTSDDVDGQARLTNRPDRTDVSETACPAAAEDEPEFALQDMAHDALDLGFGRRQIR